MRFNRSEVWDLAKALFLVSTAFFILGVSAGYPATPLTYGLVVAVVGGAVIFHEVGHKYVAQRYGHVARFVSNDFMLLVGVVMAFTGFIFIAPGAVHVKGVRDKRRNAFIAWAGPAVNAVLAVLGLLLVLITPFTQYFSLVFQINAILGGFNMLPVPGFDGVTIWRGDRSLYLATAVLLGLLVFGSFQV